MRTVVVVVGFVAWFLVSVHQIPWSSAAETTGNVTEFALPIANPGYPPKPDGIAAGADGNLWVAEPGVNKIARVTPTGTITEFPVPGGLLPTAVTAGPDGNVWFAQRGGVGFITPAGKVKVYKVDGIISSITPGPDGNLWFTENFRGKIGRVTPSGQITLFNIPTPPGGASRNPLTIAAGPDGNLWFTESHPDANKIQIKMAIEDLYKADKVTVVAVNVLTKQPRTKSTGTRRGRVVVGLTDFERQWDASQRLALLAVPHRGARSVPP